MFLLGPNLKGPHFWRPFSQKLWRHPGSRKSVTLLGAKCMKIRNSIVFAMTTVLSGCVAAPPNVPGTLQEPSLTREYIASNGKKYRLLHTPRSNGFKALSTVFEPVRPTQEAAIEAKSEYLSVAKEVHQPNCLRFGENFTAEVEGSGIRFSSKFNSWSFDMTCMDPAE